MQFHQPMSKRQFQRFFRIMKLVKCKFQPFNDYRDWYMDCHNHLYNFYTNYLEAPEEQTKTYVTLIEIKENHIDNEESTISPLLGLSVEELEKHIEELVTNKSK
jgi:hypothetical protein